jgi:hypothetical protein
VEASWLGRHHVMTMAIGVGANGTVFTLAALEVLVDLTHG